ncbi:hypothetical protein WA026_001790 [Henosepilachna vigintioctopunctata]|uniref:Uncharacterized protein n=1 Tax=Henosepilachna vigintioctopunctata TaxID=420089 RepID=A0AAW1UJ99_9CUCU
MRNKIRGNESKIGDDHCVNVGVLHLNVQGVHGKEGALEMFLSDHKNSEVACFSEHWLKEEEVAFFSLHGWKIAHSFSRSVMGRGGVMTLCRSAVNFVCHSDVNRHSVEFHCELSSIKLVNVDLLIIAVYRSPSGNMHIFLDTFEKLFNSIGKYDSRII